MIRSWKDAAGEGSAQLFENPRWASGEIAGSYEWDSTYFKDSDPLEEGEELVQVKLLTVDGAQTEGVYRKPSMVFSISKNSENPEAAAQILNCLLTEPEGIAALGDTRGLPASKIAAQTLSDAGAIDPTLVSANQINMETEGPNVSPFKEHPVVRWLFQDSLELFAYDRLGDHQWRQRSPRGLQQLNRVRALPGAPCHIDCIAIKAGKRGAEGTRHLAPTRHVWIRNCRMERGHGADVIGSEMSGDVSGIDIRRCENLRLRDVRLLDLEGASSELSETVAVDLARSLPRQALRVDDRSSQAWMADICKVAGLGEFQGHFRDGTAMYYSSEPRVSDDPKGVGPLMFAAAEAHLAGIEIEGEAEDTI